MIKTLVTAGSYTANDLLPLTLYKNTNNKYTLNNNGIQIKTTDLTNIKANVILTAIGAGVITLQAYADGNAIAGATSEVTATSGDIYTLHINDVVRTVLQQNLTFETITFTLSQDCTLVGGDVILSYER